MKIRSKNQGVIRVYSDLETARVELAARRSTTTLEAPPQVRETSRAVFGADLSPSEVVQRVIADVREEGDAAVRRYTLAFDGVDVGDLVVAPEELDAALEEISPEVRGALVLAADRIRRFHERGRRESWLDFAQGSAMGQLIVPLGRVGIYAPGGRAAYPSTVLMAAIPARVAGVAEVVLTTPPGPDGRLNPAVLAAARIAGVDRVYRMGGAQAIAALAYGTETVEKVDKIVGPGSIFVVLAKQAVAGAGAVGIEMLPGPTETVVVADGTADARWIAADMIAQAEHDPMAQSVLICTERPLAEAVIRELEAQLEGAARREVIAESFDRRGAVVVADSLDAALAFANEHAPEHLCLSVADPWAHLPKVRNAGGVFVGERSVEALGDYTAGPSHIMPTGGTARYASALSLDDFIKVVPVFSYEPTQLRKEAEAAIALARTEGLAGHAAAIRARLEDRAGSGPLIPSPSTLQPSPTRGEGAKRPRPRDAVERMAPYEPAESATAEEQPRIRLDSNENPYGPSPRVARTLAEFGRFHEYPDPEQKTLRRAIAGYAAVDPESVMVGSGSDELIDLLCRVYVGPGDEVIDCTPTFGMYRFSTELCGGVIVEAPRDDEWHVDLDAVRRALSPRSRIVFVASPNNPTGTQEVAEAIGPLLDLDLVVVVDEAYVEFSQQPSLARLVKSSPNLVVLRTFSKWAGLAGLRVGYGLFPSEIIANLWKVKPPFNVNQAADAAVRASLEDLPLLRERVQHMVRERDRMAEGLAEVDGLRVWPSEGNFVLVQYGEGRSKTFKAHLNSRGIAVRAYSHPRLSNAVRISVGLPEHTDALLEAARGWALTA